MARTIRKYELFIGYVKELDIDDSNTLAGTGEKAREYDLRTLKGDEDFLKFTNHQLKASINFSKEGSSGKDPQQTLEIYNPSDRTVEYIETGNAVFLAAGYEDDPILPVITASQIKKANLVRNVDTSCLKLLLSDAYKAKRGTRINKTYPATLTYGDVIDDLLDILKGYGVPSRAQTYDLYEVQLKSAMSFSDGIFEALDDILKPINYKWYMAAGILYIEPTVKSVTDEFIDVLDINIENVKNSIEVLKDTSKKDLAESSTDGGSGIKIVINLNGNLSSGDAVRVNYGDHEGQYKITSVKHVMDYEGTAWDTIIECVKI